MLPFIYKWECVYDKKGNVIAENVKDDAGSLTKYGIDQRSHPQVDIYNLNEKQAREIYLKEYWEKYRCESHPKPLGEVFFNCCVNCGYGRAQKILAQAKTAETFLQEQEAFYRRLVAAKPKLQKFLRGWLNRTADLKRFINTL